MRPFKILQLVELGETGDCYYRMRWPIKSLAVQRPEWALLNLSAKARQRYELALEADLLVLFQSNDIGMLPIIRERTRRGLKTLTEYNDNFYAPQPWSPIAQAWSVPTLWRTYETFMEIASGVVVTGHGLHELFSANISSEKIHVLENHLPYIPDRSASSKSGEKIVIGWAGSLGHMADFLAIVPAVTAVMQSHSHVHFRTMGNETIPQLIPGIPKERYSHTNWGTMDQYYNFWCCADIGIAPLLSTPYNRCRSDIKAVEIAGCGSAPILSDALPYMEFATATNAPTFKSQSELVALLNKFTTNYSERLALCNRAFDYVKNARQAISRLERAELYEKFLPVSPCTRQSEIWRVGANEELGIEDLSSPDGKLIAEATSLVQRGAFSDAKAILHEVIKANEDHLDARVLLAQIMCVSKDADAESFITAGRLRHKKDFRFTDTWLKPAPTLSSWETDLGLLASKEPTEARFFAKLLVKKMLRSLQQDSSFLPVAERLLDLVPNQANLRLLIAEILRVNNNPSASKNHFQKLIESKQLLEDSKEFISGIETGYLSAWSDALSSISKDSL